MQSTMKTCKSINSLLTNGGAQAQSNLQSQMLAAGPRRGQPVEGPHFGQPTRGGQNGENSAPTSPICRCRVVYLGSSVPHITKDGLQGIQEPLRELYPDRTSLSSLSNAGIDSWLSVWSNGILIENVDETGREMKRFFKIEALHYCAAVKFVGQPAADGQSSQAHSLPKFLPLDSPHARLDQSNESPPIFASILRRTTGVKVLECHAFICKREAAANALVRCCFHAYADTMYAKQIGAELEGDGRAELPSRPLGQAATLRRPAGGEPGALARARRSKSIAALNDDSGAEQSDQNNNNNNNCISSFYQKASNGRSNSLARRSGAQENNESGQTSGAELSDASQQPAGSQLRKQYQLSKSMHQLDRADQQAAGLGAALDYASQMGSHSASIHNLASSKARWARPGPGEPDEPPAFYNPHAGRVPSYPPQSLLDQQQQQQRQANGGGTLRSIRSAAANSIASTLLRSKRHAKAMSAAQAQLQQQQQQTYIPPLGFHQPHLSGSATLAPSQSFMMPPVAPLFLPRLPLVNGSQTMKLPRSQQQLGAPPFAPANFEAMTPKEMKRLLKKSAKYGLDPSLLAAECAPAGLLPFRPLQMPVQLPPAPPSLQSNQKSGTMSSQSLYSVDQSLQQQHQQQPPAPAPPQQLDMADFAASLPAPPFQFQEGPMDRAFGPPAPIKSILVKPNPEFLKSRAGKKWLKQQKEFKKLLPPHLDGLPIVFGPPPMDALEPANTSSDSAAANGLLPLPSFLQPPPPPLPPMMLPPPNGAHTLARSGLPMMDSNGFYSQASQSMYMMPSERASTASTLLRYSPRAMQQQQQQQLAMDSQEAYASPQRGHTLHGSQALNMMVPLPPPVRDPYFGAGLMGGDQSQLVYANQMGATLDHNQRQYLLQGADPVGHHRHRKHMVEQSVISLGDENEGDEEEEEEQEREEDEQADGERERLGPNGHASNGTTSHHQKRNRGQGREGEEEDGRLNGYYNRVAEPSSSQQDYCDDQQNYEQVMAPEPPSVPADDQASYSSGIYRKGHLNERAFSYSIRQEHQAGARPANERVAPTNLNADYANRVSMDHHHHNQHNHHHHQQQAGAFHDKHRPIVYRQPGDTTGAHHHNFDNDTRQLDHISARLESQLNLRTFVDSSRVRSHM